MTEIILDSNIIISLANGTLNPLKIFSGNRLYVSDITRLEVFGYHKLKSKEEKALHAFFENVNQIEIRPLIISEAILLRQKLKMSLGDAIIAATAQIYNIPLYTRNVKDFDPIKGLSIINPFNPNE